MTDIDSDPRNVVLTDDWHGIIVRRERGRPRARRSVIGWALLIALTLHIGIFIALRTDVIDVHRNDSDALAVELINWTPADFAVPEPALPQPAPRAAKPSASAAPSVRIVTSPSEPSPISATPIETTPSVHLYNADGSIDVPTDLARQLDAPPTTRAIDAPPIADNRVMVHERPLKVRPNHFDAAWQATHAGSALDQFVANHLVKSTDIMRMPWGTRVQCAWIVIIAGCAWGPPDVWHPSQTWKPSTALDEY
jgi:hypothetical protein